MAFAASPRSLADCTASFTSARIWFLNVSDVLSSTSYPHWLTMAKTVNRDSLVSRETVFGISGTGGGAGAAAGAGACPLAGAGASWAKHGLTLSASKTALNERRKREFRKGLL